MEEGTPDGSLWTLTNDDALSNLDVGTQVYVRNRFLGDWTSGFEIAEVFDTGFRIRRLSDGHAFPDVFAPDDVRLERRQSPADGLAGPHRDRRH